MHLYGRQTKLSQSIYTRELLLALACFPIDPNLSAKKSFCTSILHHHPIPSPSCYATTSPHHPCHAEPLLARNLHPCIISTFEALQAQLLSTITVSSCTFTVVHSSAITKLHFRMDIWLHIVVINCIMKLCFCCIYFSPPLKGVSQNITTESQFWCYVWGEKN